MATKKKTYPELERLRAVRARQATVLARHQAAVLGKEAKRQLKPLIDAPQEAEVALVGAPEIDLKFNFSSITRAMEESFKRVLLSPIWPTGYFDISTRLKAL